jgi:hypothetical protein
MERNLLTKEVLYIPEITFPKDGKTKGKPNVINSFILSILGFAKRDFS